MSGNVAVHVYLYSGTSYRFLEARPGLFGEEPNADTLILEFGLNSPLIKEVKCKNLVFEKLDPNKGFLTFPGRVSLRQTASGYMNMLESSKKSLVERRWKLAESWISKCSSSHWTCQARRCSPNNLPTRLVHVPFGPMAPEPRYHFIDNTSQSRPKLGHNYLTLSHRWTSQDPLYRTTKQNIAERLEIGIARKELPALFTDAIDAALRLRVPFLWIDSLCIIQGDKIDWAVECTRMADVYMNSFLNISATSVASSEDGLSSSFEVHPRIVTTCWEDERRAGQYRVIDPDFWQGRITDAEINSRGWVVQERSLAPRVLHFAFDQLVWECCEVSAAEEFPDGIPTKYVGDYVGGGANFKQVTNLVLPPDTIANPQDRDRYRRSHDIWRRLGNMYARCELTQPDKDKLMAISGLAKATQRELGDEYLAGLWKGNLVGDLLWRVRKTRRQIRGSVPDGFNLRRWDYSTRATNYRAPSWSWASVDGLVEFGEYLDISGQPKISEEGDMVFLVTSSPMALVLDVSTTLVIPDDPFGNVCGGKLIVKGKMYKLGTKQEFGHRDTVISATGQRIFDDIDAPLSWDIYNEAYFLPLAHVIRRWKSRPSGVTESHKRVRELRTSDIETHDKSEHDQDSEPAFSKIDQVTETLAALDCEDPSDCENSIHRIAGIEICPTQDRGAFRRIGHMSMQASDLQKITGCINPSELLSEEAYSDSNDVCTPDAATLGGDAVVGIFEIV